MIVWTAYITLAHKRDGDWEAADWTISTGQRALDSAYARAKKFTEDGFELVSIREVGKHEEYAPTKVRWMPDAYLDRALRACYSYDRLAADYAARRCLSVGRDGSDGFEGGSTSSGEGDRASEESTSE